MPELTSRLLSEYNLVIAYNLNFLNSPNQNKALEKWFVLTTIIIIAVAIESFLNRLNHDVPRIDKKDFLKEYLDWKLKQTPDNDIEKAYLVENIKDIFILRNVLVHNYIYEYEIDENLDGIKLVNSRSKNYWNPDFEKNIDIITNKTLKLGLNVMPDNVDIDDLKIVVEYYYRLLKVISVGRNNILQNTHYLGTIITFENVLTNFINNNAAGKIWKRVV